MKLSKVIILVMLTITILIIKVILQFTFIDYSDTNNINSLMITIH